MTPNSERIASTLTYKSLALTGELAAPVTCGSFEGSHNAAWPRVHPQIATWPSGAINAADVR